MDSGPIATKTLQNYLQKQFPPTMKINTTMLSNVKVCVEMFHLKYRNNTETIPPNKMRRVFHKNSLNNAPQNCSSKPTFGKIYKDCIMEVLAGDVQNQHFPL